MRRDASKVWEEVKRCDEDRVGVWEEVKMEYGKSMRWDEKGTNRVREEYEMK